LQGLAQFFQFQFSLANQHLHVDKPPYHMVQKGMRYNLKRQPEGHCGPSCPLYGAHSAAAGLGRGAEGSKIMSTWKQAGGLLQGA
jgi:hypothetical protein